MRNAELVADRLVVQSGSNHSGHRAADLAPWHSSVVQMSASPRVIRPRAWPDWSLHSARSTARCLSGVSGAGREPGAARESARARRHAIKMKIKMKGAPMAIKMKFCHFDFSICAANSDRYFLKFHEDEVIGPLFGVRTATAWGVQNPFRKLTRKHGGSPRRDS